MTVIRYFYEHTFSLMKNIETIHLQISSHQAPVQEVTQQACKNDPNLPIPVLPQEENLVNNEQKDLQTAISPDKQHSSATKSADLYTSDKEIPQALSPVPINANARGNKGAHPPKPAAQDRPKRKSKKPKKFEEYVLIWFLGTTIVGFIRN